ncbi:MAG: hypothetical protein A2020_08115 [Lentisphaerae bacterium GWF2_45_14]|nr:MAG: hypothetical protein A2020_08115 [Lentisphaerae bacterium GWF2_45_14]
MENTKKIRRDDVAKAAGVSKAVVTWVMAGTAKDRKISDATIAKVEKAIKMLNYRPCIWGKLINTQKSGLIAFISSNLSDPNAGEIIRNINISVRRKGYGLMLFDLYGSGKFSSESIVKFEDCLAEAFILHAPGDDILKFCSKGKFAGKPFCVLGRNMKNRDMPSVEVDNFKGAELAIMHLLEKKVLKLGIIADEKHLQYTKERLEGCEKFFKAYPELKTYLYFRTSSENQHEAGSNAIKKWISSREIPDVVFAMGDVIALGALSEINDLHVKCPEEFKIVGFDGAVISEYSSPPLTTVRQPFEKMCEKAVEICVLGIRGEKFDNIHFSLEPELIVRKTT